MLISDDKLILIGHFISGVINCGTTTSSELLINALQTSKIYALIWYLQSAAFKYTAQNDLKLGQCLDIDEMTSPSKFGSA